MEPVLILALIAVGLGAGILGAIFGLGGGIIFVPVLTIIFGLTASEAAAESLVGIIATSAGATTYLIKNGYSNIRLGLLLETTTCVGAMIGAFIAVYIANWTLLVIFGCVLIYGATMMILRKERIIENVNEDSKMCFSYTDNGVTKSYEAVNVKSGLAVSGIAGVLASMTGVGGGTIKVPLMNIHMRVPIKVATATSSYMVGITAFSGAMVFFVSGNLLLDYAAAIAIGAFLGSMVGARISKKVDAGPLRRYFAILLIAIAITTFLKAGGVL
jgi:uncharacterized membrane protein YfcA